MGADADPAAADLPVVFVDPGRRFQVIDGFGGAFTEAAAITWQALTPADQHRLLQDYFDPLQGHGYTFCRVHINSCDFALGNYAHADTPGDVALHSFSIQRDRQALLPFIQAALQVAGRPVRLLASPWSPPAWMKSNGRMNDGGQLLPQYAAVWAQCYVRFIQAYAAEGVPVWGVSVQNEPEATQRWDSCRYTAAQERDFVRDHLGPALHAAGLGHIRIVVWDHNRDRLVERAATVYNDAAAARYVWGAGFHWYGEDHFEQVQLLHDAWPNKKLLFTEGCQEGGPHHGSWALGERYARNIINDLNRWTVGWIDWNLLLDRSGGPNHVGNFCSAPVLADFADCADLADRAAESQPAGQGSSALRHQSSFFYIGHFARFFQPGAQRVLCASGRHSLEATAGVNPDNSLVTVVLNRSDAAIHCVLRCGAGGGLGKGVDADSQQTLLTLPAHAIVTCVLPPPA